MSFYQAITENNAAKVNSLLQRDVDHNRSIHAGYSPLHMCAIKGRKEISKILLKCKGVDPNVKHVTLGYTPLHLAVSNGQTGIVHILLACDTVDPNAQGHSGSTPLHFSITWANRDAFEGILEHKKTDLNMKDHQSWNALHFAVDYDQIFFFDTLLKKKNILLSVGSRNDQGHLPFFYVPNEEGGWSTVVKKWAKGRFTDLCLSFKSLDLPVLQLLLIVEMDSIQYGYKRFLPTLFVQWEWAKIVKRA